MSKTTKSEKMSCKSCGKDNSKTPSHHLCELCTVLTEKCRDGLATNSNRVMPDEGAIRKAECDICLEYYQEDKLQAHQATCMARLVFQCTMCAGEYISKEGLWNHLDLHEIADDSKQSHFKERRVTHKLHKCVLCNDQRGYQESHYWEHVHEDHDGFFLRCSECGDCFRSQKRMTDHAANHCKAREETVPSSSSNVSDDNQTGSDHDHTEMLVDEVSTSSIRTSFIDADGSEKSNEKSDESSTTARNIDPLRTKCSDCQKECKSNSRLIQHVLFFHEKVDCEICGVSIASRSRLQYHKIKHHSEPKYKCPHCPEQYHFKSSLDCHLASHVEERKFPCEICGRKFKNLKYLNMHLRRTHYVMGAWKRLKSLYTDNKGGGEKSSQVTVEVQVKKPNCSLVSKKKSLDNKPVDAEIESSKVSNDSQKSSYSDHAQIPETEKIRSSLIAAGNEKSESTTTTALDVDPLLTECTECKKECYSYALLTEHISAFHEAVFCDICGISIPSRSRLQYHKLKRHSDPRLQCPYCPRKYHVKFHLNHHFRNNHRGKKIPNVLKLQTSRKHSVAKKVQSDTKPKRKIATKPNKIQCPHCEDVFQEEAALARHVENRHEPVSCDIRGVSSPSRWQDMYHKLKHHSQLKLKCPVCPMKFSAKKSYQQHLASHDNMDAESNNPVSVEVEPSKLNIPAENDPDEPPATNESKVDSEENLANPEALKRQQQESTATIAEEHGGKSSTVKATKKSVFCIICAMSFANLEQLQRHKITCFQDTSKISEAKQEIPSDMDSELDLSGTASNFMTSSDHEHVAIKCEEDTTDSISSMDIFVDDIKIEETSLSVVDNASSETSTIRCHHCDKRYEKEVELSRHVERSHKPFLCTICGITLAGSTQYGYHKLIKHSEPKFQCPHCPVKNHTKYQYELHLSTHMKDRKFACEVCGKRYKNIHYLSVHMQRIHRVEGAWKKTKERFTARNKQQQDTSNDSIALSTNEKLAESDGESISSAETHIKCPHCGNKFLNNVDLTSHIESSHQPMICQICGVASLGAGQHSYHKLKYHTEPAYTCSQCPKTFHTKQNHQNHEATHTNECKFSCELCEKKFKTQAYAIRHLWRAHRVRKSGRTPLKSTSSEVSCPHCDQQFRDESELNRHVGNRHMPISCDTCGTTCIGKSQFQYHKLTSHTEPNFQCPHCPKKCYTKRSYRFHVNTHVKEKTIPCELCTHKFKSLDYLSHHMHRTHRVKGAWKKVRASKERQTTDDVKPLLTETAPSDALS